MSLVLTANEICARALRAIGAFPITESAPDGEALREAMSWLDLIMGEFAGSTKVFWLVTATLDIPLTNGTQSYDLVDALGSDLPIDRVQWPVEAWLEDGNGNRTPLVIVTLEKFESVSRVDETGPPCRIHIDRSSTPQLRVFPTPATTDTNSYTIKLVVQKFAPKLAPLGVTGTTPSGTSVTGIPQAWQRWLVLQLSHDLGSGPIHKIGEQSLARFIGGAKEAKEALLAFENREHDTEPPLCEPAWE